MKTTIFCTLALAKASNCFEDPQRQQDNHHGAAWQKGNYQEPNPLDDLLADHAAYDYKYKIEENLIPPRERYRPSPYVREPIFVNCEIKLLHGEENGGGSI